VLDDALQSSTCLHRAKATQSRLVSSYDGLDDEPLSSTAWDGF
jgi:hypothetical protein